MSSAEPMVRIGRVVKPHGIAGEVVVEAVGETFAVLGPGARVWVGDPGHERSVVATRPHAGRWLVALDGVPDRNAAEELRGAWLEVPRSKLVPPGESEAYVDDLVGCTLEDEELGVVGIVTGVRAGGAQDLLEVETDDGHRFVPMVGAWLRTLDVEARRILMRLPDGLLDDTPPPAERSD